MRTKKPLQQEERTQAWIDDEAKLISFHEIPNSRLLPASCEEFWQAILSLLEAGYRVQ